MYLFVKFVTLSLLFKYKSGYGYLIGDPVNKQDMLLKTSTTIINKALGLFLLLFLSLNIQAQDAKITIQNMDVLCAGFGENSVAQVNISTNTPFRLPNNAGIVYDWYAYHENGNKEWNTPLENRKMPTPWVGEYNIWAVIKYVNKTTLSPFNAFKSQVIKLTVEACPDEKKGPTRTTNQKKN